jgi:hypothetical protein
LHFAGSGRRGRRHVDDDELTISNKIERTHEPRLRQERLISDACVSPVHAMTSTGEGGGPEAREA